MYNKVILMGRICHDLELKTTPNGVSVLSFRIAVDRSFAAKGEERKTDFFDVVSWRQTAEFISRYFGKGRMILIDGELQTRQYVDKNNQTRNVTEIVVDNASFTGEPKASFNSAGSYQNQSGYQTSYPGGPHPAEAVSVPPVMSSGEPQDFVDMSDTDDDYPF
ncbi:MAG: single-stranded DNA-binding protein [Eubacterium sp.]|jgi:single-strand DNA-binding protein|nr:single-stranded DNA-binding protein [Eubacterium sp.]